MRERKIKTALHVASSKGHSHIVKYILNQCPDSIMDFSPDLERNALHYACNKKSTIEVLELLLDKGHMDVNSPARGAWLPLHYAIGCGRLDLCRYLVKKGADVHKELENGGNSLSLAACSKNEEMVKWLIDLGVSPNTQDKQGLTPLHKLSRFGDLNMTKLFVEYGNADVQLLDNSGCSVMEEADRNNMSEIATYLWTKGCESTSIKNPDGLGPTSWFRLRHIKLPSTRYGAGMACIGNKIVLFSGLGQPEPDFVNHDNENHMPGDTMTCALKDTYIADMSTVEHLSMVPSGVLPARPEISLSSVKCGRWIRLDEDGLGGWSIPFSKGPRGDANGALAGADADYFSEDDHDRLTASIVKATKPFKKEEKFGYFEVTVVNAGESRILTLGLVDEDYPVNEKQPGWDKDSYGYHGDDGGCFHNNGAGKAWAERFNPGDVIGCGVNFEGNGEIFWTKNGKFLGVSHIGPQASAYYAAIGVENDGAIFKVNFGKTPFQFSFVVPTLTWQKAPSQDEYCCAMGRLVPLPEVDEILAIPDRINALSSKVWLFNMRTTKWRSHQCVGVRPLILNGSQHVRLGNTVYVWNSHKANQDDKSSMAHRIPALYMLDLEFWTWAELLSYNVLADASIDDNLNPIETDSDDSDQDDSSSSSTSESDSEDDKSSKINEKEILRKSNSLRQSLKSSTSRSLAASSSSGATGPSAHPVNVDPLLLDTSDQGQKERDEAKKSTGAAGDDVNALSSSSSTALSAATMSSNKSSSQPIQTKLTLKEAKSLRMHSVVTLLDSEFKDAFMVAMGDELIFVAHMKMLRFNPKTFVFGTYVLRGTRPLITHHSAIAVGTDIVTFGGWDDRKQQNELFILDTKAKLWYKPHIGGLLFPRPRNNHSSVFFETSNPKFAIDPSDDSESSILEPYNLDEINRSQQQQLGSRTEASENSDSVPTSSSSSNQVTGSGSSSHLNSLPSDATSHSSTGSSTGGVSSSSSSPSLSDVTPMYRFCIFAMGWNGTNTMNDFDIVALDTTKRVEELGVMLDASSFESSSSSVSASSSSSSSSSQGVDFDVKLEVNYDGQVTVMGAHKAILWARSDYFKAKLTEELLDDATDMKTKTMMTEVIHGAKEEHVKALLRFLYTDHVNVVQLLDDYRGFVKVAEKYAPNHVPRLVAEYLHTKVYEPERLNEEVLELLNSGAFADVTLTVNGTQFKAHKAVLVARSQFFRALLTGGLKESTQKEIDLGPDFCDPPEFQALLRFLYSKSVDYSTISEYILPLFTLATRCDARRLKSILESLIAFNLDSSNVASLLVLADQLSASSLKRSCTDVILRDPSSVQYEEQGLKETVAELLKM
jgi:ankyrin repeat protein